jgi:SAM-dependent methyltransferase
MATVDREPVPVILKEEERALLGEAVGQSLSAGPVRVLEAGCGSYWFIHSDVPVHITGVDTDAAAMRLRQERTGDLDVAIVGDLRSVQLPSEAFDVAYCSYVLEHVEGAEAVLDKLVATVRPGGRLIIRVPDGDSVFGFFAKHTPHRTHIWYKRYIQGNSKAGQPGHPPYPTVYDPVVSLAGMRRWAQTHGLAIESQYALNGHMKHFGRYSAIVGFLLQVVSRLSGGRLAHDHSDIGFVFVRPGRPAVDATMPRGESLEA